MKKQKGHLLDRFGIIIGSVIAVAVLVGGYLFLIAPTITGVRQTANTTQEAAENALKEKEDQLMQLKRIAAEFDNLSVAERRRIETMLPDEINIPLLYQEMDRFVRESGGVLNSMSVVEAAGDGSETAPATPTDTGDAASVRAITHSGIVPATIQLTMEMPGDYAAFVQLIDKIEAHSPILEMQSLAFQPGSSELNLSFDTFTFAN